MSDLIDFTDTGNGRLLADHHNAAIRWNATRKRWMAWDGRRWAPDDRGMAMARAKATAELMVIDALDIDDADRKKRAIGWASKSLNVNKLRDMLEAAKSEPGMTVLEEELDTDPWLLNVANGTVDLRTGELHDHDPDKLLTKLAPVAWDPDAAAERWERFLEEVLPDEDVRSFVARALGYSCTGSTSEEVLLVPYGSGANGKTALLEGAKRVLGDYAVVADPTILLAKSFDDHPVGIAALAGRRLVLASESDDGRRLAEATVKRLTGGDTLTARFMRQDPFQFKPTHTIWLATNHRPEVRGTDDGIWRRLRVVPFEVTIPEDQRDHELDEKLAAEASGILGWLVRGCLEWQRIGLAAPAAVMQATNTYRMAQDEVGAFIDERCVVGDDENDTASNLYQAYTSWATEAGLAPATQRSFGEELARRGFDRHKATTGSRRWEWIGLRSPQQIQLEVSR